MPPDALNAYTSLELVFVCDSSKFLALYAINYCPHIVSYDVYVAPC